MMYLPRARRAQKVARVEEVAPPDRPGGGRTFLPTMATPSTTMTTTSSISIATTNDDDAAVVSPPFYFRGRRKSQGSRQPFLQNSRGRVLGNSVGTLHL